MGKNLSMTERVLRDLKHEIVNCTYSGDELITEACVSQKYGVSKTPAREALGHLCIEGFLEKLPHKGYLIKRISFVELQNLFQFRFILEAAAAELAVRYATTEDILRLESICRQADGMSDEMASRQYNEINHSFHLALAQTTRNPYIVSSLTNTLEQLRRTLTMDFRTSDAKALIAAHLEVVHAIQARDEERARNITRQHISAAQNRIYARQSYWVGP